MANGIGGLKTPVDLAEAQADLVGGLRGCSVNLRGLEADVPRVYNLDVIDEFTCNVAPWSTTVSTTCPTSLTTSRIGTTGSTGGY